jgi:hypothetical protein
MEIFKLVALFWTMVFQVFLLTSTLLGVLFTSLKSANNDKEAAIVGWVVIPCLLVNLLIPILFTNRLTIT